MRTIRFRAWIPTDYRGNPYMFYQGDQYLQSFLKRCVFMCNDHGRDHEKYGHYELEQFTGLHDKNGKEIYEGDILFDGKYYWEVSWNNDHACFQVKTENAIAEIIDNQNMIVKGNIHQSNELL